MSVKVTLLGDSIRLIGYGKHVPAMLGEDFSVYQPSDNCRFTFYTMRMIFDEWDNIKDSKIIHWNNGLWDANDLFGDGPFTKIETYTDNLERMAALLQRNGARLIFATTTPVRPDTPNHTMERIREYNSAAVEALSKHGVIINDLFGILVGDVYKYIRDDDKIHLTDTAELICAEKVCRAIREAAAKL